MAPPADRPATEMGGELLGGAAGAMTGAVAGAVLGGPPAAVVGGIAGAALGVAAGREGDEPHLPAHDGLTDEDAHGTSP